MVATAPTVELRPQPGPQEAFLASPADIVFFGGAAGGGKTYALLLEPLRHITSVDGFGAVFFRRTTPQITGEGGLWDETFNIYPHFHATEREGLLDWHFPPYDNAVKFVHMEHERNRFNWKGAQIPLICFDQIEDFTRSQFFYMLSRNRSGCGVRPYIRATYNPVPPDEDPGGWLHEFVGWYLDENGEYPDPDKAGVVRWFINIDERLHWFDSEAAAQGAYPDIPPKSFSFIPASVFDNAILLERDPGYLANLYALDLVDQERLLNGNHLIKPSAGKVFNRAWFEVVDALPAEIGRQVRFWDLAATERKQRNNAHAATAGVRMARSAVATEAGGTPQYTYYVLDVAEQQFDPGKTDALLKNTASQDGRHVAVRWEQEGGSAGKRDAAYITRMLAGYDARGVPPQGDKLARSRALAAQAYAGNVKVLRGPWNDAFLNHMHAIPDGSRWDIHDAAAGAFNELVKPTRDVPEQQDWLR